MLFLVVVIFVGCESSQRLDGPTSDDVPWINPEYAEGFRWRFLPDSTRELEVLDLESENREPLIHIAIAPGEPFERLACLSTTHLTLLQAAEALETAVAGAYLSYVVDSTLRAAIDAGRIQSLGSTGEPEIEVLLESQADAFLSYPFGGATHQAILEANIPVIPMCEYLELHPLGRAEWMVFLGLLTGHEMPASRAFSRIQSEYERVLAEVQIASQFTAEQNAPLVFAGSQTASTWYAPGGQSLMAQFIQDAGGAYLFADHPTRANVELDVEVLLERARTAHHWGLVTHSEVPLTRELLWEEEPLLAGLPFAKSPRGVFACNTAVRDYFGNAIVEPHLILNDLKYIFSGDTSAYQPHYFQIIAP